MKAVDTAGPDRAECEYGLHQWSGATEMKVIYIAGPYRAECEYGVHHNIQAAEAVARDVWSLGAVALCPHKNSAYLGGIVPDDAFLAGGIELLKRSDALLLLDDWEDSEGARQEHAVALERGMPILRSVLELDLWLGLQNDEPCEDDEDEETAEPLMDANGRE